MEESCNGCPFVREVQAREQAYERHQLAMQLIEEDRTFDEVQARTGITRRAYVALQMQLGRTI